MIPAYRWEVCVVLPQALKFLYVCIFIMPLGLHKQRINYIYNIDLDMIY
jgi:hypothetical protein